MSLLFFFSLYPIFKTGPDKVVDNEEELANKDKRIKQLEAKLGLALSEARNLSEQLSNYSHREMLGSSIYGRRSSQELTPDQSRTSFRGSMYRRPSTFAGSDHSDEVEDNLLSSPNLSQDDG
uniref:Uncharacterized protein n=1 Tax=Biomphalaria glabrata TaxID=6526 RepID=A0A2C9LQ61_BIOGL